MGKQYVQRTPKGPAKKRKTKIRGNQKLKGFSGSAANFITRRYALRKTQLNLTQFRKLCILKGIYPRRPKVAPKGNDKTYYLKKDIVYLMHDPIIRSLGERKAWRKKMKKAREKKLFTVLDSLRNQKPVYSLNHLVKERYPTFLDALRDIDDALTLIYLFARLPATYRIKSARVNNCQKLTKEFEFYIMKTHSLRKVFVSIKGIYYQAEIQGQKVTWIVPFNLTLSILKNVDYGVMLSFLEFYEVLLGFINFKLYHDIGMKYPPKLALEKIKMGDHLEAIERGTLKNKEKKQPQTQQQRESGKVVEKGELVSEVAEKNRKEESKARVATLSQALSALNEEESEDSEDVAGEGEAEDGDEGEDKGKGEEEEEDEDEEEEEKEDEKQEKEEKDSAGSVAAKTDSEKQTAKGDANESEDETFFKNDEMNILRTQQEEFEHLFSKCHVWINRETPKDSLEFVIKSFGGRVSWEGIGNVNDLSITHEIVDRPKLLNQKVANRDYIQPQWVYDCVNATILLPVDEYGPESKLPPHLSPFVDDRAEGYLPDYRKKLDQLIQEKKMLPAALTQQPILAEIPKEEESESDEEERYAEELAAEKEGKYEESEPAPKPKSNKAKNKRIQEEEEQEKTAAALLSNKNRRIINRIRGTKTRQQRKVSKLEQKKKRLDEGEAIIKNNIIVSNQQ